MPDPRPFSPPSDRAALEAELRAGLADLTAAGPDPTTRVDATATAVADRRSALVRRRHLLVGSAATATVAAGGGLAWRLAADRQRGGTQRLDMAGSSTTGTEPEPPNSPALRGSWLPITAAPLNGRQRPHVVWAGDRLLVWGGVGFPDAGGLRPDGATWIPATSAWAPVATSPGTLDGGFAVWTGSEVVVGITEADSRAPWNRDVSVIDARDGIMAYDPAADAWRYVAPVVPPEGSLLGSSRQAVVVGDHLLVGVDLVMPGSDGHDGDLTLVHLATGEQIAVDPGPFAASPYDDASGQVTLTTVGDLVVAVPNWDLPPWVLDPLAGTWHRSAGPGASDSLHLLPAVAAGAQALLIESDGPGLWAFDPVADTWQAAAAPGTGRSRPVIRHDPVWTGRELLLPGSAYDPAADTWREVPSPPLGPDRQRVGVVAAWTGEALVLFGGEEYACPDGADCDRDPGPATLTGWYLPLA